MFLGGIPGMNMGSPMQWLSPGGGSGQYDRDLPDLYLGSPGQWLDSAEYLGYAALVASAGVGISYYSQTAGLTVAIGGGLFGLLAVRSIWNV